MNTSPKRINHGVPPGVLPMAFRAKQKWRTAYGQKRDGNPASRSSDRAPSRTVRLARSTQELFLGIPGIE
eukprot:2520441-Prorocentrum_lima.AAC.1